MSLIPKSIMRKVIGSEYVGACQYTGYIDRSIRLDLECGHQMFRKASAGVPLKAKCHECTRDQVS